ncbi:MAG: CAP domain-containing protein [Terriglobales bacterium]
MFAALAGFTLVLACNLISGMPIGTPAAVMAAAAQPNGDSPPAGPEGQLFELVNQARRQHGLGPLAWNERLAAAAREHSEGMARHGKLTHNLPGEPRLRERLSAVPLDRSAENVARNTGVEDAHQAFMLSPLHRANILNPEYNAAGIGIVRKDDAYWVTQNFARVIPELDDSAAEDEVARAFEAARRQGRSARLKRVRMDELRRLACSMADAGQLKTARALQLPAARYAVTFQSTDPGRLPPEVARVRDARGVYSYAVGVCFKRTPQYPSGVYWVALVLFGGQ